MIYIAADRLPVPELIHQTQQLRHLIEDLERIRDGQHPSEPALADAPHLDDWSVVECRTVAIAGTVTSHPNIRNGRQVCTSDLWVIAPALGYARTLNRLYTLGRRQRPLYRSFQ
jgi:hypothetical protein